MALVRYRRRSYGTSKTKLLTRRSANRTFAKKKTQWVTSFNTDCVVTDNAPLSDCPNGFVIPLLTNDDLRNQFEDGVRVLRIRGTLHVIPLALSGANPPDVLAQWSSAYVIARLGLKKTQIDPATGVATAWNPLKGDPGDFEDFQPYADGKWMKLWQHMFFPSGGMTIGQQPATCCPVVTSTPVDSALVAGTGTIIWPGINTECIPCDLEGQPPLANFNANVHVGWNCPIDYRRPIRLTEADDLAIWGGWERLDYDGTGRKTQPTLRVMGGIRLLLEK